MYRLLHRHGGVAVALEALARIRQGLRRVGNFHTVLGAAYSRHAAECHDQHDSVVVMPGSVDLEAMADRVARHSALVLLPAEYQLKSWSHQHATQVAARAARVIEALTVETLTPDAVQTLDLLMRQTAAATRHEQVQAEAQAAVDRYIAALPERSPAGNERERFAFLLSTINRPGSAVYIGMDESGQRTFGLTTIASNGARELSRAG